MIIDEIEKLLPETFYAGLPINERVKKLVESWQNAIKVGDELQKELNLIKNPFNLSEIEQIELKKDLEILANNKQVFPENLF